MPRQPFRLVPPVLTAAQLPVAELSALLLDEECVALDGAALPPGEPATPLHRLLAAEGGLDGRLVLERLSALWVHGCLPHPPAVHTAALSRERRVRLPTMSRVLVRETNVTGREVQRLNGQERLGVTTPARTLLDLALQSEPLGAEPLAAAARLLRSHPTAMADAARAIRDARHTPGRTRALHRLALIGERAVMLEGAAAG